MLLLEIKDIDDEMGTQLPKWVKAKNAKESNAKYEMHASRATKELVARVKRLLVLMYPRSRQYTNFRAKDVTVKIDKPSHKDLSNPTLADNDAHLFNTYGVQKRSVGSGISIIYHIPYQE